MTTNRTQHARSKHLELDIHFARLKVAAKMLKVQYVSSIDQLADLFTKGLPSNHFRTFRSNLCVLSHASIEVVIE